MSEETAAPVPAEDNAPPEQTAPAASTAPTDDLGDAGKRALEAERKLARDAERRAKVAERELENLRKASMSEAEKAVTEAEARGRTAALTQVGQRLAAAEFKAAAATKGLDVAGLLEDINLARFVSEDGEPDVKAIAATVDRFAALRGEVKPPTFDGGARSPAQSTSMDDLIRSHVGVRT